MSLKRHVITLAGGTASAQLVTAIATPILTYLYPPSDIGILALFMALFNVLAPVASLRYENAFHLADSLQDCLKIYRLCIVLIAFSALTSVLVYLLLYNFRFFGFERTPFWTIAVLPFMLIGYGTFMVFRSLVLREGAMKIIARSTVYRALSVALSKIMLGLFTPGALGLILSELFGAWASFSAVKKKAFSMLDRASAWSFSDIKATALKYFNFARFEAPSVLLNQLSQALPVMILSGVYDYAIAGVYALARSLYAIPNGQIGKSVADVLQMELGRRIRAKEISQFIRVFYKFFIFLAITGLVPLCLALFFAVPLAQYIFDNSWSGIGTVIKLIAPWMYLSLVVSSLSRVLIIINQQHWKFIYDLVALLLVVSALFIARASGNAALDFVYYLNIGMSASYIIYLVVIVLRLKFFVSQKEK